MRENTPAVEPSHSRGVLFLRGYGICPSNASTRTRSASHRPSVKVISITSRL